LEIGDQLAWLKLANQGAPLGDKPADKAPDDVRAMALRVCTRLKGCIPDTPTMDAWIAGYEDQRAGVPYRDVIARLSGRFGLIGPRLEHFWRAGWYQGLAHGDAAYSGWRLNRGRHVSV
jgi:hypothetical protein